MRVTRATILAWAATLLVSIALLGMPLVVLAAPAGVNIVNFTFAPANVQINVGETVTWTNSDSAAHSAKFAAFTTPVLMQGQRATLTFSSPGRYPYVCGVHGSSMSGTVIVQAAATPPPPPPTQPPPPPPTAPLPTAARTPAPAAATPEPTTAPTDAPTEAPTATPAPTASVAIVSPAASASASPVAVIVPSPTVAAAADTAPGPLLVGAAALAAAGLAAIAVLVARRR